MKTLNLILFLSLFLFAATDSMAGDKKKKAVSNSFLLSGLKCEGCAAGLKFELDEIKAIKSAKINFDKKLATISYDPKRISTPELLKTIKKLGYEAKLQPKKAPEPKRK